MKFAKRRRRLIGAAVLTAVVTGTDWPTKLLTGFWGAHPLASSILSGVVLLVFAAFVVEAILEERELRNWEYVAKVAYYSLGHMSSEILAGMDFLVTANVQRHHDPPLDDEETGCLQAVLRARGEGHESVDLDLAPLVQDLRWLRVAREGLSALKFRHRNSVARWIPAMSVTESRARLLNAVALLDDKRDAVETSIIALIKVHDPTYPDAAPPATDPELEAARVLGSWVSVYQESIALQELLMHLGRGDEWRSVPGRARLSTPAIAALDRRVSELRDAFA
jgi:hypothetical protein